MALVPVLCYALETNTVMDAAVSVTGRTRLDPDQVAALLHRDPEDDVVLSIDGVTGVRVMTTTVEVWRSAPNRFEVTAIGDATPTYVEGSRRPNEVTIRGFYAGSLPFAEIARDAAVALALRRPPNSGTPSPVTSQSVATSPSVSPTGSMGWTVGPTSERRGTMSRMLIPRTRLPGARVPAPEPPPAPSAPPPRRLLTIEEDE